MLHTETVEGTALKKFGTRGNAVVFKDFLENKYGLRTDFMRKIH